MLSARLSGVKAQLRMQVRPGDRVIAYVGALERLFVGDAGVERGYHRWREDEAARFPDWLGYDHGITLVAVRVWPRAVPLMSVWPHMIGARTNPKALWFGGVIKLLPSDGRAILAAGVGGSNEAPEDQGTARADSANPAVSRAARTARGVRSSAWERPASRLDARCCSWGQQGSRLLRLPRATASRCPMRSRVPTGE